MRTIRITPAFLERAAKAKASRPCSARVSRGKTYADVAYRDWCDHYSIHTKDGVWLCSFIDSSIRGQPRFEAITTAKDIQLKLPA